VSTKFRAGPRDRQGLPVIRGQPIRHPPAGTDGMPRRLLQRGGGICIRLAQEWASQQPWYGLRIDHCRKAPCSTTRYYYWILKEEPT
jgi:hypothetical protein